jgi:uncharacterized membrane protein YbhN (UPF0104 family)
MLKPLGIQLRFHEYFGITTIARTLNLILPFKGGAGIRAYYLKVNHNLSVTEFAAMFAGQSVLSLFIAALTSLCGLTALYFETNIYNQISVIFVSTITIVFGFFVFWSPILKPNKNRIWSMIKNILDSWHIMRKNKTIVAKVLVIAFINVLLSSFSIGILFHALSNGQPIGTSIFLGGSQDISYLASFTPGSLGIVEASTLFFSRNLSINLSDALLVALINRTIIFSTSGIIAPFYIYYLLRNKFRGLLKPSVEVKKNE